MNDSVIADGRDESKGVDDPRRQYSPPTLVVFGHVAALTQSASGCAMDDSPPCSTPPGLMGPMLASDRRLKQNISKVGMHPLGFGLYLFDYKPEYQAQWGSGRHFGVMADEVEPIVPQAVTLHRDGYKVVSYESLGITLGAH